MEEVYDCVMVAILPIGYGQVCVCATASACVEKLDRCSSVPVHVWTLIRQVLVCASACVETYRCVFVLAQV